MLPSSTLISEISYRIDLGTGGVCTPPTNTTLVSLIVFPVYASSQVYLDQSSPVTGKRSSVIFFNSSSKKSSRLSVSQLVQTLVVLEHDFPGPLHWIPSRSKT